MPNFLEMLRLANIFNPQAMAGMGPQLGNDLPSQGGISGNMSMFPPKRPNPFENISFGAEQPFQNMAQPSPAVLPQTQSPSDIIAERMRQIYQPESMAANRFNELINNMPERQNPGWLRRIAASLTAFGPGGYEGGMEVLNRPYTQALESWKDKIVPAQAAANLERQSNINERQLAYQTVTNQLRAEKEATDKEETARKLATAEFRAQSYDLKNRGWKFNFQGPTVIATNPNGQVVNTGFPSGQMNEMDKIALQQQGTLQAIDVTGANTRRLEELRQTGREDIAETRGWQIYNVPDPNNPGQMKAVKINQITGDVMDISGVGPVSRPSSDATRGEMPSQIKIRQFINARELRNTRPDLAQFIKLGMGNDFEIEPPKTTRWGVSGPTPEQYREIQDIIFQGELPISQPGRTGSAAPIPNNQQVITKTQTNKRTGEKRTLWSNDGGLTWKVVENATPSVPISPSVSH